MWPPPNSIYLKTLTNSNYVRPLLWYAVFLSSPAIFDSWADPPPLAHSCLLSCCSWHHIQKSSSLSAVPSKTKRDIKRLSRGSVDMNISEPSVSVRRRAESGCARGNGRVVVGGDVAKELPLALYVKTQQWRLRALSFSNTKSLRLKLKPLIPFQQPHSSSPNPIPSVLFHAIPFRAVLFFPPTQVGLKQTGAVCLTLAVWSDYIFSSVLRFCRKAPFPFSSPHLFFSSPLSSITKHLYSSSCALCLPPDYAADGRDVEEMSNKSERIWNVF